MTQLITLHARRERQSAGPEQDPFAADTGDLRQQAALFASVAREIRSAADRAEDAERQLQLRRNRSGQ